MALVLLSGPRRQAPMGAGATSQGSATHCASPHSSGRLLAPTPTPSGDTPGTPTDTQRLRGSASPRPCLGLQPGATHTLSPCGCPSGPQSPHCPAPTLPGATSCTILSSRDVGARGPPALGFCVQLALGEALHLRVDFGDTTGTEIRLQDTTEAVAVTAFHQYRKGRCPVLLGLEAEIQAWGRGVGQEEGRGPLSLDPQQPGDPPHLKTSAWGQGSGVRGQGTWAPSYRQIPETIAIAGGSSPALQTHSTAHKSFCAQLPTFHFMKERQE